MIISEDFLNANNVPKTQKLVTLKTLLMLSIFFSAKTSLDSDQDGLLNYSGSKKGLLIKYVLSL